MNLHSEFVFRIVFEGRDNYRVMDKLNQVHRAELAGSLRRETSLRPAVGDWVTGRFQPGDWVVIDGVCDRLNLLARKLPGRESRTQSIAANIDTLFVVTSANQDLNANRLDRYLALATSCGLCPVILVNKVELACAPGQLLDALALRFPGVDIHGMSAVNGWNLDALDLYATEGKTVAFVGSSGVGKSTLTNVLLGEDAISTQAVRAGDSRGRHTTTARELHMLPSGAAVIDTPGLRQVGLPDHTELSSSFADIEDMAGQCKFTDCQHLAEPACAILQALEEGVLKVGRWESYQKLQREVAFEKRKSSKELQAEHKKKWARIHISQRAREKLRKG